MTDDGYCITSREIRLVLEAESVCNSVCIHMFWKEVASTRWSSPPAAVPWQERVTASAQCTQ
jgi:hypothetical protein